MSRSGRADPLIGPAPRRNPLGVALEPAVEAALVEHALRGARVQGVLRLALAVFTLAVVLTVPPARDRAVCLTLAVAFAAWASAIAVLSRSGGRRLVRYIWLTLLIDISALCALTVLAAASDRQSWTEDVLLAGFVVLPVLASAQLRPRVCAFISAATVLAYFAANAAARAANGQPWTVVILGTGVLSALGVGCVLLSRLQRSRVLAIGRLAADRSQLLAEITGIEQRERRDLAENLHDGALQYVLSARQNLVDAGSGDADAFARIEYALRESARLLRTTMTDLHPAVLAEAGLPAALRDITAAIAERASLHATVRTEDWPAVVDPAAEILLFGTARELLANVAKHAHARSVEVRLAVADGHARLSVIDDGVGLDQSAADARVANGHIGLAARRARLAAAGGRLTVSAVERHGTCIVADLPLSCPPKS